MKFKIRHVILAAANSAVLITAAVMTAVGGSMAKSQKYNYAAGKWGGENGNYTQMSCFFSGDSGFSTDSVNGVRSNILSELQTVSVSAEAGKTLVPDAYSASLGICQVTSNTKSRTEADITAVGGDFFLFRDFELLDGVYFTKDDTMQDGAVIDRNLAWALYGSDKISGMDMYINGVKFYIAGVIDLPDTKPEKQCAGKASRAYISYDMADEISRGSSGVGKAAGYSGGTGADGGGMPDTAPGAAVEKVTCYECIIPNPVEGFAKNTVKKIFDEQYKGKVSIVSNTERFDPKKRAKAHKKLSSSVVRDNGVIYPYWENASRIVEYKLTRLYHIRKLILLIPLLTLLWIAFRLVCLWRRKKYGIKKFLSFKLSRLSYNIRRLLSRRKKTDSE